LTTLDVNGERRVFDGDTSMPLLWYLRDDLAPTGTKLGCGIASGVRGTPAFFVNGVLHPDSRDLDGLPRVVARALDHAGMPLGAASGPLHLDR